MTGENGTTCGNVSMECSPSKDEKVGTKWTAAEDELLTSLYSKYDKDIVKRNLNHRTWHGIRCRARRLGLKSVDQVKAEETLAKMKERWKNNDILKQVDEMLDSVKAKQDARDKLDTIIREVGGILESYKRAGRPISRSEIRRVTMMVLEKHCPKPDADAFVKAAADAAKERNRGKSTLSEDVKNVVRGHADELNIEQMRTTNDAAVYRRWLNVYGASPWLPNSYWQRTKQRLDQLPAKPSPVYKFPGPWQDKVVTKPNNTTVRAMQDVENGENLTRYVNADDLFKKLGVSGQGVQEAVARCPKGSIPLPGPSEPQARYFSYGKEVDKDGNPLPKLPCLLAGTRVYLCGAMDRVADGGVGWRKELTPKLQELGVVIFDPTNKPFYDNKGDESDKETRRQWLDNGEFDKLRDFMKELRGGDLRMVNNCDFTIIYVDTSVHMCGSYEEIAIANHEKKPILIVCAQGKVGTPWWLYSMVPHEHIFSTFDELMRYLHCIDGGTIIDDTGRWYFYRPDVLFAPHVMDRLKKRLV